MARMIEWDGRPFALLVKADGGPMLVPPIVFNEDGECVMGLEVLAAVTESGVTIEHPMFEGVSAERLAEFDQRLARIAETLGATMETPEEAATLRRLLAED